MDFCQCLLPGWQLMTTCGSQGIAEHLNSQTLSRPAIIGFYQYNNYAICQNGETYELVQDISQDMWPFDIDVDYLKAAKPNGLLRTWYNTEDQRAGSLFDLEFKIIFMDAGQPVANKEIGTTLTDLDEADFNEDWFKELNFEILDLYSFDFDTIRYRLNVLAKTVSL